MIVETGFTKIVFIALFINTIEKSGWKIEKIDERTYTLTRPHFGYIKHPDFSINKLLSDVLKI